MSFLQRLFGTKTPPAPNSNPSQMHPSHLTTSSPSQHLPLSQNTTRRDLLRVTLRETLHRHGMPAHWIVGESLSTTSRNGERGVHWRLLVKHWDPRILEHAIAFQQALIKRVTTFDPLASTWLSGISWQFALDDESECPPMPHPGSWTAERKGPPSVSGGIIEGPVHIAETDSDGAHSDLEKLLAVRDADFRQNAAGEPVTWQRTEPAKLSGET
jgi:hypothetical protein